MIKLTKKTLTIRKNIFAALWWLSASAPTLAQPLSALDINVMANDFRTQNEQIILKNFIELLPIPNVASNLDDMNLNADYIEEIYRSSGFTSTRFQSGGAPYIYAELLNPEATETLLLYAHFDGQPVETGNWTYPPFVPTLRDTPLSGGNLVDIDSINGLLDPELRLYARPAGDDKMPIVVIAYAIGALHQINTELPINIRMDTPITILPRANHDNNRHAENENLRLQNLRDAISVYGAILARFGA